MTDRMNHTSQDPVAARLTALQAALAIAPVPPPPVDERAAPEADVHAALTAALDPILSRVAAVAATVRRREGAWDGLDAVTAQLLLADLALIASAWRAMTSLSARRLERAHAELVEGDRLAASVLKMAGE